MGDNKNSFFVFVRHFYFPVLFLTKDKALDMSVFTVLTVMPISSATSLYFFPWRKQASKTLRVCGGSWLMADITWEIRS